MSKADQKRRRDIQRKYIRKFLENREQAAAQWRKEHPGGVKENLEDFQIFMHNVDENFKKGIEYV